MPCLDVQPAPFLSLDDHHALALLHATAYVYCLDQSNSYQHAMLFHARHQLQPTCMHIHTPALDYKSQRGSQYKGWLSGG